MNVYHKILNQLSTQNETIEELQLKINNLKITPDNNLNEQIEKIIDNKLDKLPTEDSCKSKDFTNEIKEIKDDITMIKNQIGDLVVIIESLMKMNK
jgi:hypothetical protein